MASSNINLFKNKNQVPEFIQPVQTQFRNVSLILLIIAVVSGSLTLLTYMTFRVRYQLLVSTKNKLAQQLEELRPRESMFLTVKSRIGVVDKVLASTKPMTTVIDDVMAVTGPPAIRTVGYGETGEVNVQVEVSTLEEALKITDTLVNMDDSKSIKKPTLSSFSIDKNGMRLTFTFMPNWQ